MKSRHIRLSVLLPASPGKVFTALTDSRTISKWSGQKGRVEAKVGGKVEMFDGWVKGKVTEFKPGRSLAYTWLPGDWPEDSPESVVRYTFGAAKAGTNVTLVHSNFPNEAQKKSHKNGWLEFVFAPLKDYLSTHH
jgi:uncharacterized protein YndB with AHSA1/START domain